MTESDADFETTMPGYGRGPSQFAGHVIDPAESMVRIGSPDTYRRQGIVTYLTGFELDANDWITGATAELVREGTWRGSQSLMITPTALSPWFGVISKRFPFIYTERMGVEVTFWAKMNHQRFFIGVERHFRDIVYLANAQAFTEAGGVTIFSGGADVPVLSPYVMNNATPTYHNMKLVVNWSTERYDWIYFDRFEADIRQYGIPNIVPAVTQDFIVVNISAYDPDGTQGAVVIDDVILTVDEPEK